MDRLIQPESLTLELFFVGGRKCSQVFKIRNMMHTMSVAVSLTTSNPCIFSFGRPLSILPPLSTASFTLFLSKPCEEPPLAVPPDTLLVRSTILSTGKATQDNLRSLFSKPGPHIFKDAILPIFFIGNHVAEFLLSSSLETDSLFSKAISCCDESQLTSLLRIAVESGASQVIYCLIQAGADVHGLDSEEESLLSLAVKSGRAESVRILIEFGGVLDNKLDKVLHAAAAMNRLDLMEILCLGLVDIDLNSANSDGQTPLHLAAIHGQIETVEFLINVGSQVDVADHQGWNPLHYAASHGHENAAEYLLSHSSFSKYAVTRDGKTPFALALDNGHSHLYDSLYFGDLLHRAARTDDVHTIKSCLANGANVNARDQNDWTPLHRAAFKGNFESARLLDSYGAQVDLVDGAGCTPLLRAVEAGHVQLAMYLLSHGPKASFS